MSSKTRITKKSDKVGRRIVRAWFDTIINPLLSSFKTEQTFLHKKNWTWQFQPSHLESIRPVLDMISNLYEDNLEQFIEFFPSIGADMNRHDDSAAKLLIECEALHKVLAESPALQELYEKFTAPESLAKLEVRDVDKNVAYLFGSYPQAEHLKFLAQCIVNNTGWLPSYYTTAPFWNKYDAEFLKLLEYPGIREHNKRVLKAGEALSKAAEQLITSLKATRAKLSLQYDEPLVAVETSSNDRGF